MDVLEIVSLVSSQPRRSDSDVYPGVPVSKGHVENLFGGLKEMDRGFK